MPELSVIVPVYNEAATIVVLMERLHSAVPDAQIIFVDDGSDDESLHRLRMNAHRSDVVLTKQNGGKGSAVRLGLTHAIGDYTIIQDADLEYDPCDIPKILKEAKHYHSDAVIGSRRLLKQKRSCDKWWYYAGGVFSTLCFNMLYGQRLSDMHACYKLVQTEHLRSFSFRERGFGIDTEIVVFLARKGILIREVGIAYHPRSRREGKKITMKDFFRCLYILFYRRFV